MGRQQADDLPDGLDLVDARHADVDIQQVGPLLLLPPCDLPDEVHAARQEFLLQGLFTRGVQAFPDDAQRLVRLQDLMAPG